MRGGVTRDAVAGCVREIGEMEGPWAGVEDKRGQWEAPSSVGTVSLSEVDGGGRAAFGESVQEYVPVEA